MGAVNNPNFQQGYEKLLKITDEKEIFLDEIVRYVYEAKAHSLLDIGSGEGALSFPLSEEVEKYVAIEQNPNYADRFKARGLKIITASFPLPLKDTYDFILASYSLKYCYEESAYQAFIKEAWNLLNPRGSLLVITLKREDGNWSKFIDMAKVGGTEPSHIPFSQVVEFMRTLGEVEYKEVTTYLRTSSEDDLFDSLNFMMAAGNPQRERKVLDQSTRIRNLLANHYLKNGIYKFPIEHSFALASKPSDSDN